MTDPAESSGSSPAVALGPLRILKWGLRPFSRLWPWPRPGSGSHTPLDPSDPRDLDAAIIEVQYRILMDAFGEDKGASLHDSEDPEDPPYLYQPGRLLVRAGEDAEELRRYFEENSERFGGTGDSGTLVPGLDMYFLPDGADVATVLAELDREDSGFKADLARPDHIIHVSGGGSGKMCPADEPRPPRGTDPIPAQTDETGLGKDIRVSVVDTGLWAAAETNGRSPWLGPVDGADLVSGEADKGIKPGLNKQGNVIGSYAGHGTFVAGVVRCMAPSTEIRHEAVLIKAGAAYESDIAQQLNDAVLTSFEPHIISISAGTYTRKNRGLLTFDVLWHSESRREGSSGVLVVAAAGNDSSKRPFFPAAYDWVVGVGSLDEDGQVSCFSNTGDWVDVYAHGRDLVNAFPSGTYRYHEPPASVRIRTARFDGLATWSGTSFATPIVSGEIAAHMTRTGLSAHEAKDDLFATKYRTLTGTSAGDVVAIGPPFA